jgi:hypothetical protein
MELKSSHEDKCNLDKLFLENSIISSNSSKRRIKKEYELLCETYPNIHFSSNNSNQIEMTITENKTNYKFVFNNYYPFKPPTIYYNGEPYLEVLRLKCDFQKKMVKKYKNRDCLCCESYACHDNWAPSVKILDVIEEIKLNVNFKKLILKVLMAEKIKFKYLISDIDINSYLL